MHIFPWISSSIQLSTLLVACVFVPLAEGASLNPYQIYPVGSRPETVAVGDFNGDGRQDVVLATSIADPYAMTADDLKAFVFLQRADGLLDPPLRIAYSSRAEEGDEMAGYRTRTSMTAGDLNADGLDDLVIGRRQGLSIILGNHAEIFQAARVANTTGAPSGDAMLLRDVDRDGKLDIIAHNETSGDPAWGLTVYFGDGSGGISGQRFLATLTDGGISLDAGDLDGDGWQDIVFSWYQGLGNGMEIFLSDGEGWFQAGQYVPPPADLQSIQTVAVGDFEGGDGREEVVVGGPTWSFDTKGMYLYKMHADGALGAPRLLATGAAGDTSHIPDKALSFDVDRDQRDDLLLIRSGGGLGYFEQRGWKLSVETIFAGPYLTWSGNQPIAAGDLDGDGCTDVATANYNDGLVLWLGKRCAAAARGGQPKLPPTVSSAGGPRGDRSAGHAVPSRDALDARLPSVNAPSGQLADDRFGGVRVWFPLLLLCLCAIVWWRF